MLGDDAAMLRPVVIAKAGAQKTPMLADCLDLCYLQSKMQIRIQRGGIALLC
jgi:hypothetical protein